MQHTSAPVSHRPGTHILSINYPVTVITAVKKTVINKNKKIGALDDLFDLAFKKIGLLDKTSDDLEVRRI